MITQHGLPTPCAYAWSLTHYVFYMRDHVMHETCSRHGHAIHACLHVEVGSPLIGSLSPSAQRLVQGLWPSL